MFVKWLLCCKNEIQFLKVNTAQINESTFGMLNTVVIIGQLMTY